MRKIWNLQRIGLKKDIKILIFFFKILTETELDVWFLLRMQNKLTSKIRSDRLKVSMLIFSYYIDPFYKAKVFKPSLHQIKAFLLHQITEISKVFNTESVGCTEMIR